MPRAITISAKTLGAVALPGFCPRCFWIQLHAAGLPYQIFPGIFSAIDAYGKRLVQGWFDCHPGAPPWLAPLGDIKAYRHPPHYTKFTITDRETNIVLRGTPDEILVRCDDSHVIVDYKTAKFTEHQDELFPLYEAQLNAYAVIGEQRGFSPVSALALVYTEPVTDLPAGTKDAHLTPRGFVMEFRAHIVPVEIAPESIPRLLRKVREIYDLSRPPHGVPECKNCHLLDNLIETSSGGLGSHQIASPLPPPGRNRPQNG